MRRRSQTTHALQTYVWLPPGQWVQVEIAIVAGHLPCLMGQTLLDEHRLDVSTSRKALMLDGQGYPCEQLAGGLVESELCHIVTEAVAQTVA